MFTDRKPVRTQEEIDYLRSFPEIIKYVDEHQLRLTFKARCLLWELCDGDFSSSRVRKELATLSGDPAFPTFLSWRAIGTIGCIFRSNGAPKGAKNQKFDVRSRMGSDKEYDLELERLGFLKRSGNGVFRNLKMVQKSGNRI